MLLDKRRFWTFLEWVAEKPHLRESLMKTGWASWDHKWREEIFKKTFKPTRLNNSVTFEDCSRTA
jgi:hypothetical protein